jgi:hypothetical protein
MVGPVLAMSALNALKKSMISRLKDASSVCGERFLNCTREEMMNLNRYSSAYKKRHE